MNNKLPQFLTREAQRPWGWDRRHDCGLWLADWVVFCLGIPDPARDIRGAYDTEAQCHAQFGTAALPRVLRRICREIGLKRTNDPMIGDIAALAVRVGAGPKDRVAVGSIRAQHGWVIPGNAFDGVSTGIARLPDDIVTAIGCWRVPFEAP